MPDPIIEEKESSQALAQREIERHLARRGQEIGSQAGGHRNPFGALAGPEVPPEFGTGYDGTVTVTPFMFDMSEFDGEDVLL